ncbi:MAG: glycosyltransferase family 4 protein, partial [Pirellulales bacterium]
TFCQVSPKRCCSAALPRVVIDLEKLRHINCGLGRFSLHLGRGIHAAAAGRFEPVFLLPKEGWRHFPGITAAGLTVTPWRKEAVQRCLRPLLPSWCRGRRPALWHSTNQMTKYLPLDSRVPVLLTIHDLNFLHEAGVDAEPSDRARKLADIQRRVDRATAIVTDSRWVADDVARHVDLGDRPVYVVPLGVAAPLPAAAARPAFLPPGPFLLTVGNALPHKNFHVLLDLVAAEPGTRLVIAGKKTTPYGAHLQRLIGERGLAGRVIMPGEVSDADRQWLYERCEAFFFPSLTEGFGFPVLEAMQCGRPVFCSRRTSLPEIAGDLGEYLDAYDGPSLAAAYRAGMARFHADPQRAGTLRRHAAAYSWAATARGYAAVYASLLGLDGTVSGGMEPAATGIPPLRRAC